MNDKRHFLCRIEDIPNGKQKLFDVDGKTLVAIRLNEKVYVVTNQCSHQDKRLHGGRVQGEVLNCPFHAAKFCLKTGKALSGPAIHPIEVHDVFIDDGEVSIEIKEINRYLEAMAKLPIAPIQAKS